METLREARENMPLGPVAILSAFIIASQVFVLPTFLDPSNLAKLLLCSVACFVVLLLAPPRHVTLGFFDGLFLLFLLFLLASTLTSPYHAHSSTALLSIALLASYRVVAGRLLTAGQEAAPVLFLRFFAGFILIVALLGLFEFFHFSLLGKSVDPLIPYLLPPDLTRRVVGIYGQPNLFALLLLIGLLAYIYLYLHDESFAPCRLRVFYFLPILLVATVFFLTGSRAGQLAWVLTFLPLCLLVARRHYLEGEPPLRRTFFYLLGCIALGYLLSSGLNSLYSASAARGFSDTGVSTEARFVFWTAAAFIFRDHPWLGVGLDNFKFYLPRYVNEAHQWLGFVQYEAMGYTRWAHNELLQLACEGGVVVLLLLLLLLTAFIRQFYLLAGGQRQWSSLKLYSHLFLVPFLVQSMFSWPLRHPALLLLFFTFLVILLGQYPVQTYALPRILSRGLRGVALCALAVTLLVLVQEVRMGEFARRMTPENAREDFHEFQKLVSNPYSEYPLLLKITPRYVQVAVQEQDRHFAEQILPYVKRLTDLQGVYWQWYNLSLIHRILGQDEEAMSAISRAIELQPTEEIYWAFQHYLNMRKASEKTGRALDEFLPVPPGGSAQKVKEKYEFFD